MNKHMCQVRERVNMALRLRKPVRALYAHFSTFSRLTTGSDATDFTDEGGDSCAAERKGDGVLAGVPGELASVGGGVG